MKAEIVFTESRTYRAVIELPDSVTSIDDIRDDANKIEPPWFEAVKTQHPRWAEDCLEEIEFRDILSFSRVSSRQTKR